MHQQVSDRYLSHREYLEGDHVTLREHLQRRMAEVGESGLRDAEWAEANRLGLFNKEMEHDNA